MRCATQVVVLKVQGRRAPLVPAALGAQGAEGGVAQGPHLRRPPAQPRCVVEDIMRPDNRSQQVAVEWASSSCSTESQAARSCRSTTNVLVK
jgi:hypothetical protein